MLLLHRVQTSTSFPSAHVFPGGNLSPFHEPPLPAPDRPEHHQDSPAYRLAAIRETFEESGILLARPLGAAAGAAASAPLVTIPDPLAARAARRAVHDDERRFADWLADSAAHPPRGAAPLVDELVPFTRWVTPAWSKGRRFSTQMYLFLMPLSAAAAAAASSLPSSGEVVAAPTSDGGIEHTAATFAAPREWLRRQEAGEIVLFPPQCFLLTMVARAFEGAGVGADYAAQRRALLDFVTRVPPAPEEEGNSQAGEREKMHPTAMIPWTEKVMSPEVLFVRRSDGRLVLGIDKPAAELRGIGRGGDFERVVLARFGKEGPRDVEVRNREDVFQEEREADAREQGEEKGRSKI